MAFIHFVLYDPSQGVRWRWRRCGGNSPYLKPLREENTMRKGIFDFVKKWKNWSSAVNGHAYIHFVLYDPTTKTNKTLSTYQIFSTVLKLITQQGAGFHKKDARCLKYSKRYFLAFYLPCHHREDLGYSSILSNGRLFLGNPVGLLIWFEF